MLLLRSYIFSLWHVNRPLSSLLLRCRTTVRTSQQHIRGQLLTGTQPLAYDLCWTLSLSYLQPTQLSPLLPLAAFVTFSQVFCSPEVFADLSENGESLTFQSFSLIIADHCLPLIPVLASRSDPHIRVAKSKVELLVEAVDGARATGIAEVSLS